MIFLMDHPSREAALLYGSLKKAGYSFRTVAFEDEKVQAWIGSAADCRTVL